MSRPLSLRAFVSTISFVATIVALAVCGSLILLTTLLHQATVTAARGVQSVHLAAEAQVDLMLLGRTVDPLVREDVVADLRDTLMRAREIVTSDAEEQALSEAIARVEALPREGGQPEPSREAFKALADFIALNAEQAQRAKARAARWERAGTLVGIGGGLLLLAASIALVMWARAALRPLLALDEAMRRFGKGDASARAPESGPGEIREMAARFNDMASAIAAQRRAQTAFLGGVAHDLRSPLAALKLAVSLLPQKNGGAATRIDRQIHRLERMVGDFLDASEIEAGTLSLRLDTVDARTLAKEAVALFEPVSSEHGLTLRLPTEPLPLRCDPLRIEQVLTNLISNALKYSPDGGRVEVRVRPAGGEVLFEVSDQGMGISEEDRKRLFEPFGRVGLSKEIIPGVGLGLYVVRQIVEAHGGHIEVTSSLGRGSTFRVYIGGLIRRPELTQRAGARRFFRPRTA